MYAKAPAKLVFGDLEIVIPIAEMLGLLTAKREYQHRSGLVTRTQQPTFSLIVKRSLKRIAGARGRGATFVF
jgi:hypothetical protein